MASLRSTICFIPIILIFAVKADCPNGAKGSKICESNADCGHRKEMCLNNECCSVLDDAMACAPYAYREYTMQPMHKDQCTDDEECPDAKKCCQTIIGKYCMEADPELKKCDSGSWPVALCLDGFVCPEGHECNEDSFCCPQPRWKLRKCTVNMTDEQLEELVTCDNLVHCKLGENCCHTKLGYRCVPFKPREHIRGLNQAKGTCPLYFYDYLNADADDMCKNNTDCPKERLCCQTMAGKYCLLPDTKQYKCKGGQQPIAACEKKCPPKYTCIKSLCCPITG